MENDQFINYFICISAGQKIAKILTRSISKKVWNIKRVLREYNSRPAVMMNLAPEHALAIDYQETLDIQSTLYKDLPSFGDNAIASDVKRRAVELSVMRRRAKEEIELCKQDMICTLQNRTLEKQKVMQSIDSLKSISKQGNYSRGAISILMHRLLDLESLICYNQEIFKDAGIEGEVDLPCIVAISPFIQRTASDMQDSDDEDDVEDDMCDMYDVETEYNTNNSFSMFCFEESD